MPLSGPSEQQTQTAGGATSLAAMLNSNYAQNFGRQSTIYGGLANALMPVAEAGENQQGFSAAELSARNANAINTNAANYKNASAAIAGGRAGAGGSTYAPSGTDKQVQATIASGAAQNLSSTENQIQSENYAVGRQNFQNAVGGLEGVAAGYNPNATAGEAVGAGNSAFSDEAQMQQESNAWVGDVSGLIGGLGGAALSNPSLCIMVNTYVQTTGVKVCQVQLLQPGDSVCGVDGSMGKVLALDISEQPCLQLSNAAGDTLVCTEYHTLLLPNGGYVRAKDALGVTVKVEVGSSEITGVSPVGIRKVCQLKLDGTHTYLSGNYWSEE